MDLDQPRTPVTPGGGREERRDSSSALRVFALPTDVPQPQPPSITRHGSRPSRRRDNNGSGSNDPGTGGRADEARMTASIRRCCTLQEFSRHSISY